MKKNTIVNLVVIGALSALLLILVLYLYILYSTEPGFSELYFENITIPKTVSNGNTYEGYFVIQNRERKNSDYLYQVFFKNELIDEDRVLISSNEKVAVPFSFTPKDMVLGESYPLTIILADRELSIRYWVMGK